MKLSEKELKFMSSPLKEFVTRNYKFKILEGLLERNHIDLDGKVILEAGCGSGYSCELITGKFRPGELYAFDFMPEQVELAKKRGLPAEIFVGDITDTGLPSGKFDAVFASGVLHHVPKWRKALEEINRVLKPGGVLMLEEPNRKFVDFAERYMKFSHPQESRFDWPELTSGLNDAGFSVLDSKSQRIYAGTWKDFLCVKRD